MVKEKKYAEFSIVFTAKSNNPTVLNPDFLKLNNIVDDTYRLKKDPVCVEPFAQVVYQNGVSITSQLDKIVFSLNKPTDNINDFNEIYNISKKYLKCIPHVNYGGIGINPKFYLIFNEKYSPEQFIINNFLKCGIEQKRLLNVDLTLKYEAYENCVCTIEILPAEIKTQSEKFTKALMVTANFHHELPKNISEKIYSMYQILDDYKNDIVFFESDVINKYFS